MRGEAIETPEQILPDLGLSAKSKALLKQLHDKELTLNDFLMECAYWALRDGFNDLRPRPLPTRPDKVVEIERMGRDEMAKIDFIKLNEKFPEVKKYYADRSMVINENGARLGWLKEMLEYIPEQDLTAREQIEQRILRFRFMGDTETTERTGG